MRIHRMALCILMMSLILASCSSPGGGGSASRAEERAPQIPQRTLVIVANQVPVDLAAKGLAGGVGAGTGVAENVPATILNATLAIADERARVSPYLAEALPQLNTDSWQLFPDGTMETTYRLKRNLTWHDGKPLAADDFVFAWEVYATPEYGVDRSMPIRFISSVLAPNPQTVVIRWKERYAEAGRLTDDFPPLPRHLLESEHRAGAGGGLPNSTFWNTHYVGAGPYKLTAYDPAVSIEVSAFADHVLGRPKIDRITIQHCPPGAYQAHSA